MLCQRPQERKCYIAEETLFQELFNEPKYEAVAQTVSELWPFKIRQKAKFFSKIFC